MSATHSWTSMPVAGLVPAERADDPADLVVRSGRTGLAYLLELRWDGVRSLRQALAMLAGQASPPRQASGCGWSGGGARSSSPSSGCPRSAS